MTTVPMTASPLLWLPDELLQTITEALLPASVDREKPSEAIRFGATCRRLHALVLPIAFRVLTFWPRGDKIWQGGLGRSLPWLADFLFQNGHLVKTLSLPLFKTAAVHASTTCTCIDRCSAYRKVVLSVIADDEGRHSHGTGLLGWLFRTFERQGNHQLESLVINAVDQLDSDITGYASLVARSRNLRHLLVAGESKAASSFERIIRAIQSCPQLETLTCAIVEGMELFIDATLPVPKLKILDLTIASPVASRLRHLLAVVAPHLHTLLLYFMDDIQEDLPAPSVYFPSLVDVYLYGANSTRVLQCMIDPDSPLAGLYLDGRDPLGPAAIEAFYKAQPIPTIDRCILLWEKTDELAQVDSNLEKLRDFCERVQRGELLS